MLDWTNVERIVTDVVAVRPVYTDTGKATEVITTTGERLRDQRDIRSVKRALHRSCFIDPKAQSKSVRELLGKEIALPFYLDPDRVFIPLKMRSSKTASDPVYGYVDIAHIASIEPTPDNRCRLILRSGLALDLLCTHATAIKSKELGLKLAESLKTKPKPDTELEADVLSSVAKLIRTLTEMNRKLDDIAARLGA
ncbi:MAG TPA: hypothetical protein PLE01_00830 [Syntrophothermus lipocalidus]|nr:hypothetical protein [Syntrophothermus lipocalidus]